MRISSNATTCPALSATGSGVIEGTSVSSAGGANCASASGSGYVGSSGNYAEASHSNVTTATVQDPLLNSLDPNDTASSSNLPWSQYAFSTQAAPWTNEIGTPGFPASTSAFTNYTCCTEGPGAYKGMSSLGNASNALNYTTTGTTFITGGIGGSDGDSTTLYGNSYYIADGFSTNCWGGGNLTLDGNAYNMYNANGYAFDNTCATLNVSTGAQGLYIFNGGVELQGSTSTDAYWPPADYVFTVFSGGTSGAYYADQGNTVFGATSATNSACPGTPATYFFDGGLNISNGTENVTFCPGIYYIRNGNLTIGAGASVTGTGVTFVLEGNASFTLEGGTSTALSAPTSSCVAPSLFPETTGSNPTANPPYDGTNGEGICNVLVYQDRSDSATDTIDEGASATYNGTLYIPSAALNISGGGAISVTSTGLPGIVAASVSDTSGVPVSLTENNPSGQTGGTSSPVALLVQ